MGQCAVIPPPEFSGRNKTQLKKKKLIYTRQSQRLYLALKQYMYRRTIETEPHRQRFGFFVYKI